MNVVFCAAEAAPFVKIGGLADVVGSLPKALPALGIHPSIILPRYGCIDPEAFQLEKLAIAFETEVQGNSYDCSVWKTNLPGSTIPVYLIESEPFACTTEVYPFGQADFELTRFLLLCQAVLNVLPLLNLKPDILHVHDWHTAPLAVSIAKQRAYDPFYKETRTLLTLHNMAYQGNINGVNRLAEGLKHADRVSTVSKGYAQEIQTPEYGAGLETLVQQLPYPVEGIVNGIDVDLVNPMTDVFLPEHYNVDSAIAGKAAAKYDVQQELGLPLRPDVPLITLISRLVEQKGLDLLLPAMPLLTKRQAQWVLLGSGEPGYEIVLQELSQQCPQVRSIIGFNLSLAQRLYAASDIFLMPSRFEPCGLGQMVALRYGSIPVVRATGGLADTVIDERTHPDAGTGFQFKDYTATALVETVDVALTAYQEKPRWNALIQRAMQQDFSWNTSALAYQKLYQQLLTPVGASHG